MKNARLSILAAAFAVAGFAPAAFAQQAGGQEMDHSQHMMQSMPAPAPAAKPGPRGPAPMGMKGGGMAGMGGMGGMDHDMGGGMGCGMMGGKGGGMGGGMGGGKMGGMGGGKMGGGMKGGMGGMGGMRRGIDVPLHATGPLSHMDLTPEQDTKILKIQDQLRRKHHDIKGRMMDEQVMLRDLYLAEKQDKVAILAVYRKLGDLRLQMVEAGLDTQGKIDAVLTKEQRERLKSHHPLWMMESMD
jgi:hypothetical protein